MKKRHTYAAAERFILSREFFGMKLGLQNISEFLESIGSPQLKYDTIHLAGTNGKGSVASMLAAVYRAAGFRVGLFTSPHLIDYRERMTVDGERITKRAVIAFIDRYRPFLVKKNSRSLN
jgi:dihydrofolate synthase/folylpolyglutamate synthase